MDEKKLRNRTNLRIKSKLNIIKLIVQEWDVPRVC